VVVGQAPRSPRGRRSDGKRARVRPGTWETPLSPRQSAGRATGNQRSRLTGVRCPTSRGSELRDAAAVPPSEGNEAKREGQWGVGVLQ
jgi:hypothetical protein